MGPWMVSCIPFQPQKYLSILAIASTSAHRGYLEVTPLATDTKFLIYNPVFNEWKRIISLKSTFVNTKETPLTAAKI